MAFLILLGISFAEAAPVAGAALPRERTYKVSYVVSDGETETDCWRFSFDEVCSDNLGACGRLQLLKVAGEPKRPAFRAKLTFSDGVGGTLVARLRGVAERRGQPGSSLGGVSVVTDPATQESIHFGFTGVEDPSCLLPSFDAITLDDISPKAGTTLSAGSRVRIEASLSYSLTSESTGLIGMAVQDQDGRSLLPSSVTVAVSHGMGAVELSSQVDIPSTGVTKITVFFPLFPGTANSTSIVASVEYPVN